MSYGNGGIQPMYAASMRDAIASNDLEKMKAVAQQAKQHIQEQGDMNQALVELYDAIDRLESGYHGAHPLYASSMRDAIASNDLERMKSVAASAKKTIIEHGDLSVALIELDEAIKKLTN